MTARILALVRRAERIRWPRFTIRDLVILGLVGATLVFTASAQNAAEASREHQGQLVEQRLCTTLGRLTSLRPPPGDPRTNPSRKFDQDLHATLSQLGTDLGCR